MKPYFSVALKGIAMGIADVLPGISGGTIAFITGIYDQLIDALSEIKPKLLLQNKTYWKQIQWTFLIPLGAGIATAILLFSRIVHYLLEQQPTPLFSFFIGLILISAYLLFKELRSYSLSIIFSLIVGASCAFIIAGIPQLQISHTLPIIFASAMIAICAMLLPGISGAFLLVLLGQYEFLITAIHDFTWSTILVFGAGALTGVIAFSRVIKYLLTVHRLVTLAFLTGLMIGSLRRPWEMIDTTAPFTILVWVIVGLCIPLLLEKLQKHLTTKSESY